MKLTDVSMWADNHWKRITAEEAANIHPIGTVSACSGLFRCNLCHQYVTLANGEIIAPYFKHSKAELDKDCPQRTFSFKAPPTFEAGNHILPLKINISSRSCFDLEIGFIPVPSSYLEPRDTQKIIIKLNDSSSLIYQYSFSRFDSNTITYLSVGNEPSPEYKIEFSRPNPSLQLCWPNTVEGINEAGSLFDGYNHKKIPYDADVQVCHPYWLITSKSLCNLGQDIQFKKLCDVGNRWSSWRIYEVIATKSSKQSANFFLDYHCRLTDSPVTMYPIWPAFVESPYLIKHSKNKLYMFMQGDATAKMFPEVQIKSYPSESGNLLSLFCAERQQLISVGRAKVLRYSYLWKDPLNDTAHSPQIEVVDIRGNQILCGENIPVPIKGVLLVTSPYDGFVIIKQDSCIQGKIKLFAGKALSVDGLSHGQTISIYQGLDCVWSAILQSRSRDARSSDSELLDILAHASGLEIPISHAIGSLSLRMKDYPLVKQWLYTAIRKGYISERAYLTLKKQFGAER